MSSISHAGVPGGADAEPVDPAEQREQTMVPDLSEQLQREAELVHASRGVSGPVWIARGPAPTQSAQVRVPPDNEVSGAIQAVLPHPSDANILYIGSVNGGAWKTTNATDARPTWMPLTEFLPSQSIGALAFDRSDSTLQTLIVGVGRWSNFAQRGDDEVGIYRSTNGGGSFAQLGGTTLLGQKMSAVAARGATIYAASFGGGLFKSTDTGATWALASGANGLPTGGIASLVEHRTDANRLAIAVRGAAPKVLISSDFGSNWTDATTGINGLSASSTLRLAFGPGSVMFAAVINSGTLAGVYRSADLGLTWTALDVPAVHPGGQGSTNTALIADPVDDTAVFVSGDRITAGPFTGNVARLNSAAATGSQIRFVVDGGATNTAPHADSRAMAFDANGNLLETDDGGIYRLVNPNSAAPVWNSVIGNLNVTESHSVAKDTISQVLMIGVQDNGTHQQIAAGNSRWTFINGGDGGDVQIDSSTLGPSGGGSYRYLSSQNFGGPRRFNYSAANAFIASLSLPALPVGGDVQFVTPIELNVSTGTRMLLGGLNNLYEANNITTTAPSWTSLGAPGANRNAMAYGTRTNPDVIYTGKAAAVWKRTTAAGALTQTAALPAGAAAITDVAVHPNDENLVFAVDDNQVFRSTDGGGSWTDITGNLPSISGLDFRTSEILTVPGNERIAVGTRSGVFVTGLNTATWSRLGLALPDVLVFDMRFYPGNSGNQLGTLAIGTLGRGVYTLDFVNQDILHKNGFE